ncbi:MAG: HAD hydrolase-like protein [Candidatus Uhrbacteria bacterium]
MSNFHLFCKVCDLMFIKLGKTPISAEEVKQNFTLPYMKFWNKYFPDLSKEDQCVLYEKFIHQVGESELYKNVEEIIDLLHKNNYKIFILSSDPISKLLLEIQKTNFTESITKIVGNVHDKKDFIVSFIEDFDLDKTSTFYVGDTSGDVEAGQFAGVKTIGISWGFQNKNILAAAKPNFLINDIIEIKEVISED